LQLSLGRAVQAAMAAPLPNFHTSDENISMDQGIMSLDLF
jgi:hypothetical protein